ncbi:MAG: RidA family protein [Treponema sp.]|nr:RidA family protein [Treponema sp.]
MKTIETKTAPAAIGPYSQAILANGFLYTSGQIPLNPETGALEGSSIAAQAEQAIKNLGEILKTAGTDFSKVVKTTCILANIADFAAFNTVYEKYFVSKPARSCFEVAALPKGALVEIEAVAVVDRPA